MSKYQPTGKLSAYLPHAPSDAFGASSLPEGAIFFGFCVSTLACIMEKTPTVHPAGNNQKIFQLLEAGSFFRPCILPNSVEKAEEKIGEKFAFSR